MRFHYAQVTKLSQQCKEVWLQLLADEVLILHRIIFGSRKAVFVFTSFYASFAVLDMTSFSSRGLSIVLMSLLVISTYFMIVLVRQSRKTRPNADVEVESHNGDVQLHHIQLDKNNVDSDYIPKDVSTCSVDNPLLN